jgi:predicted nucleic acid-binding protein
MHRIVVSDSTAIIHLSRINALNLLRSVYSDILIPQAVRDELLAGGHAQPGVLAILNAGWIKVVPVRNSAVVAKLRAHLDLGESEAIALAVETSADVLVIDEKLGRSVARPLVNRIIGMVGVLLEAKKLGHITTVEPLLTQLRQTGFKLGDDVFNYALAAAGEAAKQAK